MYLSGKRIFVVEDNLENKTIAQMLLERAGAKVMIDRWGVDVMGRLAKFSPLDAILLDLMLPNQTGYDIFQEIRSLDKFSHVPIVAVSAADASIAIPRTQQLGFAGFISKPIDFQMFPLQIKQIIDGESVWHTPERL